MKKNPKTNTKLGVFLIKVQQQNHTTFTFWFENNKENGQRHQVDQA